MQLLQSKWDQAIQFVTDELGVHTYYIKKIIPGWVKKTGFESEDDLQHSLSQVAVCLRVPYDRLVQKLTPLVVDLTASRCKGALPEKLEEQKSGRLMGELLARHLVEILEFEDHPVMTTPQEARTNILQDHELITFEALIRLCWSLNIPVAHLASAPSHSPHAMAVNVDGRCAIVLFRNNKHQGWHLFDLAHELGHIMLGHVKPGQAVSDCGDSEIDPEEEYQANKYAFELFTDTSMSLSMKRIVNGETLLAACKNASTVYKVDPQWLICSVCYNWPKKYHGVGGNALKLGWPEDDALGLVETILSEKMKKLEVSRMHQAMIGSLAVR